MREIVQGKPLGHPSHALLVHYPVAYAPAAVLLDQVVRATGDSGLARAATILSGAGAATGLAAAVPGIVDWQAMVPGSRKRRVATIHFACQASGVGLLALSFAARLRGQATTPTARATALAAGATMVLFGGNLFGGELVYRMGMRVSTGPAA